MQSALFNTQLQYTAIVKMLLLVAILGLSWLWSPGHAVWNMLDIEIFAELNHPIATHPFMAEFWAILNMRPLDMIFGLLLFSLLLKGNWVVPTKDVRAALIGFVCLLLWMLVLRIIFVHILSEFSWSRPSPTLVLSDAVKLTDIFPGWDKRYYMKDASPISFPGDHASVLFIWAMFVTRYTDGYKPWLAWGLAIFLSIPRLAAGAHWVTDDVIGGLGVSMVAYASTMYTSLLSVYTDVAEDLLMPLLQHLKYLPLLRSMSFFQHLD